MSEDVSSALLNALPYATLQTITGDENLLILVPGPADESVACGGLIAESCTRGRPPFVMVLGDGTASGSGLPGASADVLARVHDRETRDAVSRLGLQNERLLMAGLYDGQIPQSGAIFDTIVRAVTLVMWARDCNVICAPWPHARVTPGERATYGIAKAVSAESGVGMLAWASDDQLADREGAAQGWRLDITSRLDLKRAALAAHAARAGHDTEFRDFEVYLRPTDGLATSKA